MRVPDYYNLRIAYGAYHDVGIIDMRFRHFQQEPVGHERSLPVQRERWAECVSRHFVPIVSAGR
jgi:hypothetical protein